MKKRKFELVIDGGDVNGRDREVFGKVSFGGHTHNFSLDTGDGMTSIYIDDRLTEEVEELEGYGDYELYDFILHEVCVAGYTLADDDSDYEDDLYDIDDDYNPLR